MRLVSCQSLFLVCFFLPSTLSEKAGKKYEIVFIPSELKAVDIVEGDVVTVLVMLKMNQTTVSTEFQQRFLSASLQSSNPKVAYPLNSTLLLVRNDSSAHLNYVGEFDVYAKTLGRTKLIFTFENTTLAQLNNLHDMEDYRVAVARPFTRYQMIFAAVVAVLMTTTTFMMGTQVEWAVIKAVLKKPIAPIIGFSCQFIIMPLSSFVLGLLLLPGNPYLQLGYFAVGCCPGGKLSNLWCILLDANLDLSVTLTACSNFIAFCMMPLWLLTLGSKVIARGTTIKIPFPNMMGTLSLIIIPTVIGMWVAVKRPKIVPFIAKWLKPVTFGLLIVLIVVSVALNTYIFLLFTWQNVLAGMLLPYSGFGIAFVVSWVVLSLFEKLQRGPYVGQMNKQDVISSDRDRSGSLSRVAPARLPPINGKDTSGNGQRTTQLEIKERRSDLRGRADSEDGSRKPESSTKTPCTKLQDVRTIAIETGIQNAGLAIILITYTLEQPDADLTLVMPVVCLLFTPIPLAIALAVMSIKKACCPRDAGTNFKPDQPGGSSNPRTTRRGKRKPLTLMPE